MAQFGIYFFLSKPHFLLSCDPKLLGIKVLAKTGLSRTPFKRTTKLCYGPI